MRPRFKYRDEDHTYWLGKLQLPTITEILCFAYPEAKKWAKVFHRDRGSATHLAIKFLVNGDLDESTLDERIKNRVFWFKEFMSDSGFKPVKNLCEVPMYHPNLLFGGTPDLVGSMAKRSAIVEIKSAQFGYAAIQTAAQERLIRKRYPAGCLRFGLQLKDDGYSLKEFTDPTDFPTFCKHMKDYKQFQKEGL